MTKLLEKVVRDASSLSPELQDAMAEILQAAKGLPQASQAEFLNSAARLLRKAREKCATDDDPDWSGLSLAMAVRGMEDEDSPEYTPADVKERAS
jgi:hypothetical protein